MKISDHIRLVWPQRAFVAFGEQLTFKDGQPPPTAAELDATRTLATQLFHSDKQPMEPPVVVTMRSFRLACGRTLWDAIESATAANPDADARWEAEQFIEHSPTVSRSHPLVAQLAAALGKTDAEVDAVFVAAQALDTQP